MRILCLIPVVVVACVMPGTPSEYRTVTPSAADETYGCALAIVDSLGYTLSASDRLTGFFRAQLAKDANTHDVLAVTALRVSDGTELHVTAETYAVFNNGVRKGQYGMTTASDKARANASLIMTRCAASPSS